MTRFYMVNRSRATKDYCRWESYQIEAPQPAWCSPKAQNQLLARSYSRVLCN
jgi:hypothetical protein